MRRGADTVNSIEIIEPGSEMNRYLLQVLSVRAYHIAWIGREMQAGRYLERKPSVTVAETQDDLASWRDPTQECPCGCSCWRLLCYEESEKGSSRMGSPVQLPIPGLEQWSDAQSESVSSECAAATVLEGDAFDLIREMPDESIDLIITSPPYWGLRTYGMDHNWDIQEDWDEETSEEDAVPTYHWYREHGGVLGLEPYPEWYVSHLVEFFSMAKRALRDDGSIWVNLGDTYFARWSSIRDGGRQGLGNNGRTRRRVPMGGYRQEKQLLLVPSRFAIAMQDNRWILRNDLIWYKPNVPPRPEKDRLRLAHEHFFHFAKRPTQGRAKYYYDKSKVESDENDVVTYYTSAGRGDHTATFPEDLITPRILSSSPPDGLVLDPFCGVGSALVVAARHGRSAIGFELSPKFVAAAQRNLNEMVDIDER